MLNLFTSFIVSFTLTFIITYFLIFNSLPESIRELGYLQHLMKTPNIPFGMITGFMAASYFAFMPLILSIPNKLKQRKSQISYTNKPIKALGHIKSILTGEDEINADIHYNGNQKIFKISKVALQKNIAVGDTITVHYDPKNPSKAYLDLLSLPGDNKSRAEEADTLFKLLDITPKFEIHNNAFEILGEIHGGHFQGQKGCIILNLPKDELAHYTPGKLIPCLISGTKHDYSIQLTTDF